MANATLTEWRLVAETKEWVGPIVVTADGTPVSTFMVSVTKGSARPSVWENAYTLESRLGVLVGVDTDWPLLVNNTYTVWVKFADTPEAPVERVGTIKVT